MGTSLSGKDSYLLSYSAHCFLHKRDDPCLFSGSQRLQCEGGWPHGAFVEVGLVVEAKRRVPRLELVGGLEEADDVAVLVGIRGHPVPGLRQERGALSLMILWSRLAMLRSGSVISAIASSTAFSLFAFSASAFRSRRVAFIAAFSSSDNPLDFCVAFLVVLFPGFMRISLSLNCRIT